MKTLFYILTFVFGLYGCLQVLRTVELFSTEGFRPVVLLFGVVGLLLAGVCLKKARAKAAHQKG
jgi:uncharacterized membrane protein HdeD (DUF308 family)